MADDWYTPTRPLASPRSPKPGTHVWTVRKNGRHVECELRFHGESYGWECQCLYDGELAYGRRFARHDLALDEAEAQRQRLLGEGWAAC